MDRVRVTSTNLLSVGYDPGSLMLEVEFQDRAIYQYLDVPASIYAGLMHAPSKGAFLHDHIKDRFHYRRVR